MKIGTRSGKVQAARVPRQDGSWTSVRIDRVKLRRKRYAAARTDRAGRDTARGHL
jgi:hypothetical protein